MDSYKLGDVIFVHDDLTLQHGWNAFAVIVFDNDLNAKVGIERNGDYVYESDFRYTESEFRLEGNLNVNTEILDNETLLKEHINKFIQKGIYLIN